MHFNVKRYFQVLGVSLSVIILTMAVLMCLPPTTLAQWFPWIAGSGQQQEDNIVVDNRSTVKVQGGKINILLMGVDVDGLRTDAIMLACIDTDAKEVKMLTIPRDTEMYIGNRYQKINAAHAFMGSNGEIGGPTATCEAVTRITGIPINYYIDFSFDAVAHVINELGPIDFEIPDLYGDGVGMVYDDPVQSLHINLPPGHYGEGGDYPGLTGQQAVWLMRYRHGNKDPNTGIFKGYVNGDSDRVEMQQKFIKAVVDQKVNAGLVMNIPKIFKAISGDIKTNLTFNDVIQYSSLITEFSSANIHSYSLPGEYGSDQNGDVWIPNMEAIREMVETEFGYDASNITTGNPNDAASVEEGKTTRTSPQQNNASQAGSSSSSGSSSGYYYDDDDDDYGYSSSSSSQSYSYDDDDDDDYSSYDDSYDDDDDEDTYTSYDDDDDDDE